MISVIVPIYNVEKFLDRCLQSLLDQTYKNFEVICVNDGGQDKSVDICMKFVAKDKRFKLIHQKNKGLSGARNTGLKHALGNFVFFLDSDDYINPKTFELTIQAMQDDFDFVAFDYKAVLESDTKYFDCKLPSRKEIIKKPLQAYINNSSKKVKLSTSVWSKLYRRSSINNIKFYEGIYYEDLLYTPQYLYTAREGVYLPCELYYYTHNPNSITNSNFTQKKAEDYLEILEQQFSFFENTDYKKQILKRVNNRIIKDILKLAQNSINRKELLNNIRPKIRQLYKNKKFNLSGLSLKQKLKLYLYCN